MIRRETLLILGAGASNPYGFPTGGTLSSFLSGFSPGAIDSLYLKALDASEDALVDFAARFNGSGQYSIDSFLVKISDRVPSVFKLGTGLIAAHISQFELDSALLNPPAPVDDWYRLLWNAISGDVNSDWPQLAENKLKIVTFNYDRSLERFLFSKAKASWDLSNEEAAVVLSYFPIYHVHGSLGALAHTSEGLTGEYRPLHNADEVQTAASSLRLMYEDREHRCPEHVGEWIIAAKQICFLGFGFDNQNIDRLRFPEIMGARFPWNSAAQTRANENPLHVFATTKNIPAARVTELFSARLNIPSPGAGYYLSGVHAAQSLLEWNCLT